MSTPQSTALAARRFPIRPATLLTALGVLVAIAVSIAFLALPGANRTTATTPVTVSQAISGSVSPIRYLGPRQAQAALTPQATQTAVGATAAAGDARLHYCLGAAQRCLP